MLSVSRPEPRDNDNKLYLSLSLFLSVSLSFSVSHTQGFLSFLNKHIYVWCHNYATTLLCFFFNTDFLVVIYQLWFLHSLSPLLSYDPLSLGNRYDIDTTLWLNTPQSGILCTVPSAGLYVNCHLLQKGRFSNECWEIWDLPKSTRQEEVLREEFTAQNTYIKNLTKSILVT